MYFIVKDTDWAFAKNLLWIGAIMSAATTTVLLAIYLAYLNGISATNGRATYISVIFSSSACALSAGPFSLKDAQIQTRIDAK